MTDLIRVALHNKLFGRPMPPGHRWLVELSSDAFTDHRIQGMVVLPGSAYMDMALTVATAAIGDRPMVLEDVVFAHALVLPAEGSRGLRLELTRGADDGWDFTAIGASTDVRHATMVIPDRPSNDDPIPAWVDPAAQGTEMDRDSLYDRMLAVGNEFGPGYRDIVKCVIGDGHAVATWTCPTVPGLTIVDTAMQTLTMATGMSDRAFALAGLERVRLAADHGSATAGRAFARVRHGARVDVDEVLGDVVLLDDQGRLIAELTGMRLRGLAPSPHAGDTLRVAVAATFTAEPLEDSLAFWFDTLGIAADVEFAGYGQVFQQLLDPSSLLSANTDGLNVVLVRPEDLYRGGRQDIAELVSYETEYLYKEIFERRVYLQHGIELPDDACVIDIGANIGMFTMFVQNECANPRVYAFEPAPKTFEVLQHNCPDANLFNYGLAEKDSVQDFTFYPNSPAYSGFAADGTRDRRAVEAVVRNMLSQTISGRSADLDPLVARFTADRLATERHRVETRTLSSVLTEHAIDRVDLLKIDAEGSELGILAGIRDEHWPLIRQVVAEVHTPEDGIRFGAVLEARGFTVQLDNQDELLRGTGYVQVYARSIESSPNGQAERAEVQGADLARAVPPAVGAADELARAFEAFRQRVAGPSLLVLCPPVESAFADMAADLPESVVIRPDEVDRSYAVLDYADVRAERLGRIPYNSRYFAALGTAISRRYLSTRRSSAKVLVLDCDQTLWTGVCGEDGPEGVRIDQHRREIQEFAVRQHDAGVLICLCSKNNPADVLDVFARRSDMPLRLDHVAAHRVNWQPKSVNLASLAEELGLGLAEFVFLDDDPVECAEVQANLPEVLTLRIPDSPAEIPGFLDHIWAFDRAMRTDEDRVRTERYHQERQRRAARTESVTFESFLASLELQVDIRAWDAGDIPRIAQLTERTNQFTTTGVRRTEAELSEALTAGTVDCRTVRVKDRFGDYGMVGAALFRQTETALAVDSFFLSCRALSRGVEQQMVAALGDIATELGNDRIEFTFVPTGRNEPARAYFEAIANSSSPNGAGTQLILTRDPSMRFGKVAAPIDTSQRDAAAGPASGKQSAGQKGTAAAKIPPIPYQRIADELRSLDAIVEAIDAGRIRHRPDQQTVFAKPTDDIENTLVTVWRHVLGVDEVGVDDNFFDLGGTSLRAVQVMAELSALTGARAPSISAYENNTIRSIAEVLRLGKGHSDGAAQVSSSEG